MTFEKVLECLHFFDGSLDIVEPFDRKDNLATTRFEQQVLQAPARMLCLGQCPNPLVVYAHRMRANAHHAVRCAHLSGHFLDPKGAAVAQPVWCAGRPLQDRGADVGTHDIDKVFDITRDVKSHIVTFEQARHDLPFPGQDVEDVGPREGGVMKKTDAQVWPQLAQV